MFGAWVWGVVTGGLAAGVLDVLAKAVHVLAAVRAFRKAK
jgi:hypothetical protein